MYAYGDAIAPLVNEAAASEIVLDPADPEGKVVVASWEPARLVYGETVLYDVYVVLGEKEVKIAEGLSGTSASVKADDLNEAIVAAGGAEAAANEVVFKVVAYCESLPDGIATVSDPVSVTTYLATFPELLYLPGNYQDWTPETAPTIPLSSVKKGFYQGIVDLRTKDGSDTEFKFSPKPAWDGDFGGEAEVHPNGSGEYPYVTGTVGVSSNIVVPSGVYYIELDKKLNILRMVQFGSLSLIGSAVGDYNWSQDVDLEFDAAAKTFSAVTTFKAGEFKMRFNHNWDCALGGSAESGYELTGGNIATDKEGEYRMVIDASVAPFAVKFINTSFPERLYVPGSHNNWTHAATVLEGNGEGLYEGFVSVGGEYGFKFTPAPDWDHGEWGFVKGSNPRVVSDEDGNPTGFILYELTDSGADNILGGSQVTYRKLIVDLTELALRTAPVTGVGIIGGFLQQFIMQTISQRVLKDIRDRMFAHMQDLPIGYFDSHSHGEVMSLYTNDTDTLDNMLSQSLPQGFSSLLTIIMVFVSMLSVSITLTVAVLVCVFIILKLIGRVTGKSAGYFLAQQDSLAKLNGYVEELVRRAVKR